MISGFFHVIEQNSKLLFITISLIILASLINHVFNNMQRKEGFGIKDLFKLFDLIPQIFKMIFELATSLADLIDILMCPFNILANLPTCMTFYALDIVGWIVWGIVAVLVAIFVWLPIWLGSSAVCITLPAWKAVCWKVGFWDIVPTRDGFMRGIEQTYNSARGSRFMYRNSSDLKKCYCIPPIRMAFNPYTKYRPYGGSSNESSGGVNIILVIAIMIFGMFAAGHMYTNAS